MSKMKKAKQVTSPRLEIFEEAEEKSVSPELGELARFLNSEVSYLGPRNQAKESQLRDEIIKDISPLVQPRGKQDSKGALRKVVGKINQMGLRPKWAVECSKPFVVEFGTNRAKVGPVLGPGQKVLKIGGPKYVVRHSFGESYDTQSVKKDYAGVKRKVLYSEIITSLENGEFARLVRCPECTRFFVSARLGQKYCNSKCSKSADTKAAPARMEEHRKGVEKKIRAAGLPKLSKLEGLIKKSKGKTAADLISQIPELSKLRVQLGEMWEDFLPVVEQLKSGGKTSQAIWNSLRSRLMKALADAQL